MPSNRKTSRVKLPPGVSEADLLSRTLPDHLAPGLDLIIVGINPGYVAALKGHHYAGPGNHFWKCLYRSGLISQPMTADDDSRLTELERIGLTNMVARTSRSSGDLSSADLRVGAEVLRTRLRQYQPLIAAFNGKGIYAAFTGRRDFHLGLQPEPLEGTNTRLFVMPSSSARCSHLPRLTDKLPYYEALKKLRDFLLKKNVEPLDEGQLVFSGSLSRKAPRPLSAASISSTSSATEVIKNKRSLPREPNSVEKVVKKEKGETSHGNGSSRCCSGSTRWPLLEPLCSEFASSSSLPENRERGHLQQGGSGDQEATVQQAGGQVKKELPEDVSSTASRRPSGPLTFSLTLHKDANPLKPSPGCLLDKDKGKITPRLRDQCEKSASVQPSRGTSPYSIKTTGEGTLSTTCSTVSALSPSCPLPCFQSQEQQTLTRGAHYSLELRLKSTITREGASKKKASPQAAPDKCAQGDGTANKMNKSKVVAARQLKERIQDEDDAIERKTCESLFVGGSRSTSASTVHGSNKSRTRLEPVVSPYFRR